MKKQSEYLGIVYLNNCKDLLDQFLMEVKDTKEKDKLLIKKRRLSLIRKLKKTNNILHKLTQL
jgi:hypothetical protein